MTTPDSHETPATNAPRTALSRGSRPHRRRWPVAVDTFREGPVPPASKLVLTAEILVTYAVTRWRMPRGDIRDVVTATRSPLAGGLETQVQVTRETWLLGERLARAVTKTLRILPTDSRCLVQSLVLSRLLSVRGIPSTLVIGARSNPAFLAHAWVEHGGYPLLPPEDFVEHKLLEL